MSCDSVSGVCSCRSGWTSADCSVDVDECLQSPCSLTEKCINLPGSYRCDISKLVIVRSNNLCIVILYFLINIDILW